MTDAEGKTVIRPETIDYWNYLSACYWAMDAGMMSDMARATGRDASKYEAMQQKATDYIRATFTNADGTFKNDILNTMQTPALFALRNHLFSGEAKTRLINRLRDNFKAHGNCLQTGFLGTSILMSTLTDNGMSDIAYELLFQHKNPSWLYSIDNGATTIWERWNSYMRNEGMGPKGMNIFNHYAYGAVCEWIWETVAGIAACSCAFLSSARRSFSAAAASICFCLSSAFCAFSRAFACCSLRLSDDFLSFSDVFTI